MGIQIRRSLVNSVLENDLDDQANVCQFLDPRFIIHVVRDPSQKGVKDPWIFRSGGIWVKSWGEQSSGSRKVVRS
jgi:hypothetical protein